MPPFKPETKDSAFPQAPLAEASPFRGIGWAVSQMENGVKVCRRGWNGRGMFIGIQYPDLNSVNNQPYVYIVNRHSERFPWNASQADLLSGDWEIAQIDR